MQVVIAYHCQFPNGFLVGPLIWYQKFEYAIGHWLQKSCEHIIGCVLCSPGCFSLFRGSALMDDNVMATYTTPATEAQHYVQYDQGELTNKRITNNRNLVHFGLTTFYVSKTFLLQ